MEHDQEEELSGSVVYFVGRRVVCSRCETNRIFLQSREIRFFLFIAPLLQLSDASTQQRATVVNALSSHTRRRSKHAERNEAVQFLRGFLGLELDGLALGLLVAAELEVLAALESHLVLVLADRALEAQDNLLCGLGLKEDEGVSGTLFMRAQRGSSLQYLLVENRLGLSAVSALLPVVPPLALRKQRRLAGLVLRDLVQRVPAALLALAVRLARLGDIDLNRAGGSAKS